MRFFHVLIALLIVGASIAGSLHLFKNRPSKPAQVIEEKAWPVSTQRLVLESATPSIPLYGRLEAPEQAHLKAAVAAEVIEVLVKEGQRVETGQLLIQLDAEEFELQVQQRQAELVDISAQIAQQQRQRQHDKDNLPLEKRLLKLNQTAVKRALQLQKKNLGTQAATDQARQTVVQQQLKIKAREQKINQYPHILKQLKARQTLRQTQLDLAKLQLQRCHIKAPFSGIIAKLESARGIRVRQGDKLLRLYNPQQLQLRAQIPDSYASHIADDLMAQKLVAKQSNGVQWHLQRLAGERLAKTAGVDALFVLTQPETALRLGQFVSVQLQLPTLEAVYKLPQAAIYSGSKVYVVENDRMQAVSVNIVARMPVKDSNRSDLLLRSADLSPDMEIVTTQLPNAIKGLKVKLLN